MELIADDRRTHDCGVTDELFGKDKAIKILDAGAGTGIAGQMVFLLNFTFLSETSQGLGLMVKEVYPRCSDHLTVILQLYFHIFTVRNEVAAR